ncbi:E3 ubiquitin-protein ligase RBBP6 [Trichinella sp. T6]|nr:E3 ubiquitin-protein ligase RBBP6 [Trichinella sp. T6]
MIVSGTTDNLTEEEKIMLMMKESTEAYDPKHYVKIPQRKRKSAWSSYCKRCRQEGHCIQNCPLLHYKRKKDC